MSSAAVHILILNRLAQDPGAATTPTAKQTKFRAVPKKKKVPEIVHVADEQQEYANHHYILIYIHPKER